ncbi:MAG TPA: SpoIIE family protein phosphatase [Acidobacteriaceae bacterium]|nr:SpoIIE family protein phosphatase [Acidobacteriaceae bacterium]
MRRHRIPRPSPTFVASCGLLIVLSLVGVKPALSQTPAQIGNPTITLTGPWKFQIGDSPLDPVTHKPLWADPSFDDSRWENVDLTPNGSADPFTNDPRYVRGWTATGHLNDWGWAWYRIRVPVLALPGTPISFATFGWVDGADDGYQIFSDGNLMGSWGDFRNQNDPTVYFTQPATFSLFRATGTPQQVTLALRFWLSPVRLAYHPFVGGLHYAPLLGESSAVNAAADISLLQNLRLQAFPPFDVCLGLFMAIVIASLVFFDRSDRVYLWVAGALLLDVINEFVFFLANFTQLVSLRMFFVELEAFSAPLILGAWGMVWWLWFQRKPAWAPKALAIGTCIYMTVGLFGHDLLFEFVPHSVSAVVETLSLPCALFLIVMLLVIVWSGLRAHRREGWFVIPAVVFLIFGQLQAVLIKLHFHGWVIVHGVMLFYSNIANLLNIAAISVLLIRRLLQSLQRQRETAIDIKNAQEVQQVILPEARTVLPGLVIESEYRPAREVGGDFFQIIPNQADDSLLIVAGDVTGKGLKAGMLVALLVGALRSTADENNDPAYILETLNRRLAGRADAQATCLALRIAKDGRADLANAGHLAPYLNGVPLPMEGALPLGMIDALEPSTMQFHLEEDDRLVLVSDGTAEATNGKGELFGFDRLQNLISSSSNAVEVATAAQAFGQEDDISVILITRTPVLTPLLA